MSAELSAIEVLANDFRSGIYRLSPTSLAVLFYTSPYLLSRENWLDRSNPLDTVSDVDWDTISAYVDGMLYEVKEPMIGLIVPFMTEFPPSNILPCDGSEYLRDDYPLLYAVIAPFFIVDADTFSVPDLRGRNVIGAGTGSGLEYRELGDARGSEYHLLDITEIPSHTHSIPLTTALPAQAGVGFAGDVTVPVITQNSGSSGGSMVHNNMPPFYVLNYGVIAC